MGFTWLQKVEWPPLFCSLVQELRAQIGTLTLPFSTFRPLGDWGEEDIAVIYQHTCLLRLRVFSKLGAALCVMTLFGTLIAGELRRSMFLCFFIIPAVALSSERVPIDKQISFWGASFSNVVGPRLVGVVLVDILNILDICASAVAFLFDPHDFLNNGGPILMATNRFVFSMCSTSGVSTSLSCLQLLTFFACQQSAQVSSNCMMNLGIAFACVGFTCYYNEVLACSIIRKEHVQNLRECAYSETLARLKTPLLLARSEMQALDQRSKGPAILAAQQRIEELWHMLTSQTTEQGQRPHFSRQEPADGPVNAGVSRPVGESLLQGNVSKRDRLYLRKRRDRKHSLHGLGAHSEPLLGITESEEEVDEAKAETWPGTDGKASSRASHTEHAQKAPAFPIQPIICHLQELTRHFPVATCLQARRALREACLQILCSPEPKRWEPCSGWQCLLCQAMNDEEDTFCACCLCERGMSQDEAGEEIEEVL